MPSFSLFKKSSSKTKKSTPTVAGSTTGTELEYSGSKLKKGGKKKAILPPPRTQSPTDSFNVLTLRGRTIDARSRELEELSIIMPPPGPSSVRGHQLRDEGFLPARTPMLVVPNSQIMSRTPSEQSKPVSIRPPVHQPLPIRPPSIRPPLLGGPRPPTIRSQSTDSDGEDPIVSRYITEGHEGRELATVPEAPPSRSWSPIDTIQQTSTFHHAPAAGSLLGRPRSHRGEIEPAHSSRSQSYHFTDPRVSTINRSQILSDDEDDEDDGRTPRHRYIEDEENDGRTPRHRYIEERKSWTSNLIQAHNPSQKSPKSKKSQSQKSQILLPESLPPLKKKVPTAIAPAPPRSEARTPAPSRSEARTPAPPRSEARTPAPPRSELVRTVGPAPPRSEYDYSLWERNDQEPEVYHYVIPRGLVVVFEDEDKNEIVRINKAGQVLPKQGKFKNAPIVVCDDAKNVLYRSSEAKDIRVSQLGLKPPQTPKAQQTPKSTQSRTQSTKAGPSHGGMSHYGSTKGRPSNTSAHQRTGSVNSVQTILVNRDGTQVPLARK